MIIFPTLLIPLKLSTFDYFQIETMTSPHKSSHQQSQKSVSAQEIDGRHKKGMNYQIEILNLLKEHSLLSKKINQQKCSFPVGTQFFKNIEFLSNKETMGGFESVKNFCDFFTKTKNFNGQTEVQFDISPHFCQNESYQKVKQRYLLTKSNSKLNFIEDIFELNIEPKKVLYSGEIKSNFFNCQEKMKSNEDLDALDDQEKISLYRTAELVRKICMVRRYELQISKKPTLDDSLNSYLRINDLKRKESIMKFKNQMQSLEESTICFFIITQPTPEAQSKELFLKNLGEKNVRFLKKFSHNFQVIFHLVIDNNPRKLTKKQKQEENIKNYINAELKVFKQQMNDKFKEMDTKIDTKFDLIMKMLNQMKQKKTQEVENKGKDQK